MARAGANGQGFFWSIGPLAHAVACIWRKAGREAWQGMMQPAKGKYEELSGRRPLGAILCKKAFVFRL